MGKASREKGARGERELATILAKHLNLEIRRNLVQYQTGGIDLTGLPWSIEVKRCETLKINAFWQQAVAQVKDNDPPPVLAYRTSRKPWRFILPTGVLVPHYPWSFDLDDTLNMPLKTFIYATRLRLAARDSQ